jgi:hypothetical protein
MSAPESTVVAPVVAEEVKATETTPAVVDTKTEEPAAVVSSTLYFKLIINPCQWIFTA